MPDTVAFRFDVTNPRAEGIISERSGEQITAITDSTREAARTIIENGYAQGRNPNDIALDLVGRINKATGDREGGIIGLSAPQIDAAINLRDRLASGNASEMSKVLDMGLRDRRFDGTIQKAIDEGATLDANQIDKMYRQYVNNSLRFRGEAIARTETGQAVLEAAHEAFQQGLEKTGYTDNAVKKVWRTAGDNKVRDSHASMDGQEVRGLNGVFESNDGARFLYPMDDSLGAGAGDIINCRCLAEYNIDFSEGLKPDSELGFIPEPPPTPPTPPPIVPPPLEFEPPPIDTAAALTAKFQNVLDISRAVASSLNYDASKIVVSDAIKKFEVGGYKWIAGGEADLSTGEITLYPDALKESSVGRITAHEVMHQKFEPVLKEYLDQSKAVMAEAEKFTNERLNPVLSAAGDLRAEYGSRWPVYAALNQFFSDVPALAKDDGVTPYSTAYWKDFSVGKVQAKYAIHETLAEMSAEHFMKMAVPGSARWKGLYKAVNRLYNLVKK